MVGRYAGADKRPGKLTRRRQLSHEERKQIYERMDRRCAYCGQRLEYEDMHVDHVKPLAKGGPDIIPNMVCSCEYCNRYKGSRDVESFRRAIYRSLGALERDSLAYRNSIKYGLIRRTHAPVVFYFERKERRCKYKWKRKKSHWPKY